MKPIWIIDDDKSIRWVFEKALARTEFAFKTFSSVPEALEALATDTPQVIVSDIRMPNGSGLDFLSEVKQRLPDIPPPPHHHHRFLRQHPPTAFPPPLFLLLFLLVLFLFLNHLLDQPLLLFLVKLAFLLLLLFLLLSIS